MKTLHLPIFTILMALLVTALSFLPQDAHAMSITVHTDKPLYNYGDTYTISGKVNPVIPNQIVSIVIQSPNYPHPSSLSVTPNSDGNYSYTLSMAIKDVSSGNFTVIAQYGISKNQTTFSYNGPPCVQQNDYWYDGAHSAPASNPRVVDSLGNAITGPVKSGQQIQVTSDLANGKNCAQTFAYIVQIQDLNGVTFSLSWITGTLPAGQSLNPAQSWTPTTAGVYTVQIFTWQSLDNPNALAPVLSTTISVEDNANLTQSSHTVSEISPKLVSGPTTIILDSPLKQFKSGVSTNNIKCEQDLQLVIKAENGYPTCIAPEHVTRLIQNGWTLSDPFNRIADTDVSSAKTYNLKQVHYYDSSNLNPKVSLYDYSYDGIDKDGLVSINNQTFYQTTLDNDIYKLKGMSMQFHNVTFSFPEGTLITPGGAFVNLDVKFKDGFEEIYGGTALVQNGTVTKISGIPIPTQYGPHVATNSITILGNHTMPQAGITIYHDKIKLLVSVDQLLTEDNVVNSTAQVVPQCITNILNQTVFSGYAGLALCPEMGYHVSSKITNYTGFYGKYDVLNSSSVVGPDTYVGTGQEEMDKVGNKMMDGNFVLEPGHNATITYDITLSTVQCIGSCPDHFNFPTVVNLTNNADFLHREKNEILYSHDGLEVKYDPQNVSLTDGQTTTLKVTILASKDVPRGTYWVMLAPGNCAGGLLILLTVSDCEK